MGKNGHSLGSDELSAGFFANAPEKKNRSSQKDKLNAAKILVRDINESSADSLTQSEEVKANRKQKTQKSTKGSSLQPVREVPEEPGSPPARDPKMLYKEISGQNLGGILAP